jgi:hypothetical protein
LLIGYGIYAVVRRGFQMRQLVSGWRGHPGHGDGQAGVCRGLRVAAQQSADRLLEYLDAAGAEHRHVSMVTSTFWTEHTEGGPIDIVYSRSQPHVSAPKHLVTASREALAKAGKL